MKKSAKLIEQERLRDLQYGSIYMLQKQILIDKLQLLMEKRHITKTQEEQVQQLISEKLQEIESKSIIDSLIKLDQLFEECLWSYQFHVNFLKQQLKMNQYMDIFIFVYLILEGYFDKKFDTFETILIEQPNPKLLTNYFIFKSNHIKISILFEVGLCKYPVIEGYKQLKGFQVKHQITFIDIKQLDYTHQLQQSLKYYLQEISSNPHKQDLPFIYQEQQFLQNNQQVGPQEAFLYDFKEECWGDLQFNVKKQRIYRWVPCELPNYGGNMDKFILQEDGMYVTERWLEIQQAIQTNQQIQLTNSSIMQRYADFKQAVNIIDFLQISADFKIKATEQEKQVISSLGNLMVIGRSGTGKTTCAILRLFSIHILLKYKVQLHNQKSNKLFFHSQIENKQIGLHCLFTTQNQMLVDEVKKIYQRMLKELQQASLESNQSLNQSMITDTQSEYDQEEENIEQNKLSNMILDELAQEMRQDGYEIEKEINRFTDYEDNDFPLFLSIKKLLFSIDNCMEYPYFQQERFLDQDNIGGDQAGWDDENGRNNIKQEIKTQQNKDLELLEQSAIKEFQFGYLDQQVSNIQENLQQKQNFDQQEKVKFRNIRVIEVNYDIFKNQFWPGVKTNLKQKREDDAVQCLVWTQIYSYIKGSQYSHQYPGNYLPKELYMKNLKGIINNEKLEEIYYIFQQYEKWKELKNYYDQMDLVNYLINSIDKNEYYSNPIHYTLIDEVQDLPHSTIKLIKKLTEQSLYCSGDTAQNISKGVGFRFQDLRSLLLPQDDTDQSNNQEFQCHQLTVNFRSHNNILQLANSLVNIMEIFFPKTIDKLKREISDLQGPTPFIIQSNNYEDLLKYLTLLGMKQIEEQVDQNLGFDKVIIVKDQESKANLPKELSQNFICLTISQCKGLEFNDVIIWNFFCDQTISLEQWQLLTKLSIDTTFEDSDVYDTKITNQLKDAKLKASNQKVQIKKLKLTNNIEFDQFQYSSLCLELKQLYVAVTRARQRILIFDLESSRRQPIQTIWQNLGVIKSLQNFIVQDIDKIACKELIQNQKNSRDGWMEQGFRMFQNKYYQEAYKCFKFAGDLKWQLKCQAYLLAQDAQKIKTEMLTLQTQINSGQMNEKDARQAKETFKANIIKSNDLFKRAGVIFKSHNQIFQAAQCYFSCEEYNTSMELFLQKGLFLEAADCAHKLKKTYHLSILLLKENYFEKALDCLEKLKEHNIMIQIIQKYKRFFTEQTYNNYMEQLVPLILGQMWNSYSGKLVETRFYEDAFKYLSKYSYKFEEERKLFDEGYILPTSDAQLIEKAFQLIKLIINHIIQRLQRSFINYNTDKLLDELKSNKINEFKISFIIDVLEQYELFDFKDFLIEYSLNNNTQQDQSIIQKIFQYSEFVNNSSLLKKNQVLQLEKFVYDYKVDEKSYNNFIGILCIFGFKQQAIEYSRIHQIRIQQLMNIRMSLNRFFDQQKLLQIIKDVKEQVQSQRAVSTNQYYQNSQNKQDFKFLTKDNKEYLANLDHLNSSIKSFFAKYSQYTQVTESFDALNIFLQIEDIKDRLNTNNPNVWKMINLGDFFRIVKFMQFLSSIFKKNGQLILQFQIFKDLCIYHNILIPVNINFKVFEIFSSQYLWVWEKSNIFPLSTQLKEFQRFKCDHQYYLVSTTHIIKMIQTQYKARVTNIFDNYFKTYQDDDIYLRNCPLTAKLFIYIQSKILGKEFIFRKSKLYNQIANEDQFKIFEACIRKQFELLLQKPNFRIDVMDIQLDDKDQIELLKLIEALSIQYLMKAQGSNQKEKQIKYIKQALQVNSFKGQQNYQFFQILTVLNDKFELSLQDNIICHCYQYGQFINRIRFGLYLDSVEYFTDAYRKYFDKHNFKRDLQLAGIVAVLSIPLIEKSQLQHNRYTFDIALSEMQIKLIQIQMNQNKEIQVILGGKNQLIDNFIRFIRLLFSFNQLDQIEFELIQVINQNVNWNFLINKILECLTDSNLQEVQKNQIYDLFNSPRQKKYYQQRLNYILLQDNEYVTSYYEFRDQIIQPDQIQNIIKKCQMSLDEVDKARIQSPCLSLIIKSYYDKFQTFLGIIFEQQFLDCFDLIEQMRIKLFQFIFKYADDSLKFRSALETLTQLKDYQNELFKSDTIYMEMKYISYNHGKREMHEKQKQSLHTLYLKIKTLYIQVKDWEDRNQNYKKANKLIDKEYELDEQIIKRRKRQQFQIEAVEIKQANLIKLSKNDQQEEKDYQQRKDFYFDNKQDQYYQYQYKKNYNYDRQNQYQKIY